MNDISGMVSTKASSTLISGFNSNDSMAIQDEGVPFEIDANSKHVVSQYTRIIFDYLKANET